MALPLFLGAFPGLTMFGTGLIAGALTAALASRMRTRVRSGHSYANAPWAVRSLMTGVVEAPALAWAGTAPQLNGLPVGSGDPRSAGEDDGAARSRPVGEDDDGAGKSHLVARTERSGPAPRSLRIGLLGSLTINGQAGALVPAQSQLIVALALHRDGLSNGQLRRLLGADAAHPKPADSLRQLIARTRRALGLAPDGRQWIEHRGHAIYALHPEATVDRMEFEALTAAGTRGADPAPLAEALNLVRGQPFTDCYYWWLEPATVEAVTALIVMASETLAQLRLRGGDPGAAVRAARIGLAADPAAEQLWRIMMRAEHAAGNLAGVRGAWGRCQDVASEVAADGQPDSATEAVYSELLAR